MPASCLIGMHPTIGWFPESQFKLAQESRFPNWFKMPAGYKRNDLTVEIYYFVPPPFFKSSFKANLLGPAPGYKILETKIGTHYLHPNSVKRGVSANPGYVVASIENIEEIIEHKKMEPIFYISDNTELKKEIKTR